MKIFSLCLAFLLYSNCLADKLRLVKLESPQEFYSTSHNPSILQLSNHSHWIKSYDSYDLNGLKPALTHVTPSRETPFTFTHTNRTNKAPFNLQTRFMAVSVKFIARNDSYRKFPPPLFYPGITCEITTSSKNSETHEVIPVLPLPIRPGRTSVQ